MYNEAKLAFIIYLWYPKTLVLYSSFSTLFMSCGDALSNIGVSDKTLKIDTLSLSSLTAHNPSNFDV